MRDAHYQSRTVVDKPCGFPLEDFCLRLHSKFKYGAHLLTPQAVAQYFRERFNLSIPLRPQLSGLLSLCGIGLEYKHVPRGVNFSGYHYFHCKKNKWQIVVRTASSDTEAITVAHELFEIIYNRCLYLHPWWEDALRINRVFTAHEGAESFAHELAVPFDMLQRKARLLGYHPWNLARQFGVSPKICATHMLSNQMSLPPFFQVGLRCYDPEPEVMNFFDRSTILAEVAWTDANDGLGICSDIQGADWEPRTVLRVGGGLCRAFRIGDECFDFGKSFDEFGFDRNVCMVARPMPNNPKYMFLQAVPAAFDDILRAA